MFNKYNIFIKKIKLNIFYLRKKKITFLKNFKNKPLRQLIYNISHLNCLNIKKIFFNKLKIILNVNSFLK